MKETVFVTGGTGFIGRYVVRDLLERGVDVRVYARSAKGFEASGFGDKVTFEVGDIGDELRLRRAMKGCRTVVHLVGIIEESPGQSVTFESVHHHGTSVVVTASRHAGVETFIHVSANGARADGVSRYQTTKWAAEEIVRSSTFKNRVVFRPSLVFGRPAAGQSEFCSQIVRTLIRPFPVWPVFGSGEYMINPVHVKNLASAVSSAALSPPSRCRSFCVGGPHAISFVEILDILGRASGIMPRRKIYQPLWLSRVLVKSTSWTGLLPISPDQLEMLVEGNTCDPSSYVSEFKIQPISFTEQSLAYLSQK